MLNAAFIMGLFACNPNASDDVISLKWTDGQVFHIAAKHKFTADMNEESPTSLTGEGDRFEPLWSDEAIWTYQVIESNFYPEQSDSLHKYSINTLGKQVPLTVFKITIDSALNDNQKLLDMDPVIYLVFRQHRNRLAGIIQFTNQDDERIETAYSSEELGRSWSILSQSNMALAPTYLAPHIARWSGGSWFLENGKEVHANIVDNTTTDVVFDDEMGGEMVNVRYEKDKPWPTWIVTDNMNARLLSSEEVESIRFNIPLRPDVPEDFNYREALKSSLNLDESLRLAQEDIDNGEYDANVYEGYEPWAGAWWPLKKGELVFGYETNKETYSRLIREEIDPIKLELDALSKEIRDIKEDSDEKKEKRTSYKEKEETLVEKLVTFYDKIQTDLDSGKIRIEDGHLIKDAVIENEGEEEKVVEKAWDYKIADLSPMDKFALAEYLNDSMGNNNPFYLSAWEILNSYNPGGEDWWGHCNGWSAAAILTHEPRETKTITVDGHEIPFTTADQKGLLTEAHYGTDTRFYGSRYNDEEDDVSDLSPANFQKLINFYLRDQGVPFVFDVTATEAVWNYPVYKTNISINENTDNSVYDLINVNTADYDSLAALQGLDKDLAAKIVERRESNGPLQAKEELKEIDGITEDIYARLEAKISVKPIERTFELVAYVTLTTDNVDEDHIDTIGNPRSIHKTWHYTLTTDETLMVIDGKWNDDESHPDFAWVPYFNSKISERGGSENPFLIYGNYLDLFGDDIEK